MSESQLRGKDERTGTAERTLQLLAFIAARPEGPAVADVVDGLGLPKATVYRMIDWCERQGFLTREPGQRRVTVGQRLVELSVGTLQAAMRQAPRHAVLEELARGVGETCNIGILERNAIVYLDRVESASFPLRLQFGVGSRVPLHCSAMGKLLLAFEPRARREALLRAAPLERFTPGTITEADRLLNELERVRAEQVSEDREEFIAGVVCLAVPVRDASNHVRAAVALQAPIARLTIEAAREHLPSLRAAAARIGATLSGTPTPAAA